MNRNAGVGIKKKTTNRVSAVQMKKAVKVLLKASLNMHDRETKVKNQSDTISKLKKKIEEQRSELNTTKTALKKANKNNEILTKKVSQLTKDMDKCKSENETLKREMTSLKKQMSRQDDTIESNMQNSAQFQPNREQQNAEPINDSASIDISESGETMEMEQTSDTNTDATLSSTNSPVRISCIECRGTVKQLNTCLSCLRKALEFVPFMGVYELNR